MKVVRVLLLRGSVGGAPQNEAGGLLGGTPQRGVWGREPPKIRRGGWETAAPQEAPFFVARPLFVQPEGPFVLLVGGTWYLRLLK